jgi:hypothetical protein
MGAQPVWEQGVGVIDANDGGSGRGGGGERGESPKGVRPLGGGMGVWACWEKKDLERGSSSESEARLPLECSTDMHLSQGKHQGTSPLVSRLVGGSSTDHQHKFTLQLNFPVHALGPGSSLGNHALVRKTNAQGQMHPGCEDSSDTNVAGVSCTIWLCPSVQ